MNKLSTNDIAKICHQANKAHCENIGDTSQSDWENAPTWQQESAIKGVEIHLDALREGEEPTGKTAHDAWKEHKEAEGWVYGPEKDADAKTHPCLTDYDELSLTQKVKDDLFIAIVKVFHKVGLV